MENWNWEIDASKKVEQEIVKKLLNDEDSVHWRQKKLDNQELKHFLRTRRGVRVLWSTFWVRFRNCRTRWIPRLIKEIFTTLKDRAALEHPTFPLDPWLFRVAAKNQAASLQCRMIHGTLRVFRETFLKAYLLEKDNPYLASKIRGTWHDLFAKRNKTIEWDDMRRVLQYRTRIKKRYKDLYSTLEEFIVIMVWWTFQGTRSWKCIWKNSWDSMEFLSWKVNLKTEVCSKTADHHLTLQWTKEVQIAKCIDELWHRDRLWDVQISQTTICLMWWLRLHCRSFWTSMYTSDEV